MKAVFFEREITVIFMFIKILYKPELAGDVIKFY